MSNLLILLLNIFKFFSSAQSCAYRCLDEKVAENGYFLSKCSVFWPKVGAESQKLEIYAVNKYYFCDYVMELVVGFTVSRDHKVLAWDDN